MNTNTQTTHKAITRSTLALQCPTTCEYIVADLLSLDPSTPVYVYEFDAGSFSVAYGWDDGSLGSMSAEEWLTS